MDAALAGAVFVFELGPVLSGAPPWSHQAFGLVDALRLLGFSAPLLARRRYPLAVLVVMVVSFAGSDLLGAGLVVGFYSVGAWARSVAVSRASAVAGTLLVAGVFVVDRNASLAGEVVLAFAVFGGAWFLGDLSRVRRRYTALLEERAALLEAERETDRERAAAQERTRIARELHDIVAHRVSMMTVQAGAAGTVADTDPKAAKTAMASVADAGRQTLTELRRLLGVLRDGDADPAPTTPCPGLECVGELARGVEASGIPVKTMVVGDLARVPEAMDASAYRIVQEALTNVMRHAGPDASADVVVRVEDDALYLEISDTGPGTSTDVTASGGHGLIGMQERAAAFGGEVFAEPGFDGGFVVRARLPLEPSA